MKRPNKLVSLHEFIVAQTAYIVDIPLMWRNTRIYSLILQRKLKPCMFVPVGEDGKPFRNPMAMDDDAGTYIEDLQRDYDFQRESLIFDGFSIINNNLNNAIKLGGQEKLIYFYDDGTIIFEGKVVYTVEDLIKYNLTLSEYTLDMIYSFDEL